MTFSALLRFVLLGAAMACVLLGPVLGSAFNGYLLLGLIAGIWLVLSYRSAQGSRIAADSPSLIASGRYEEAEERITQSLNSFSLFRPVKLMSLHHLALLRHAQKRWEESAALCRALLGQRLGQLQGIAKPSRLILADACLEMNDLRAAHEALSTLYMQRLSLGEAMNLQLVQLDYSTRIGAWEHMLMGVNVKVQLAELMPTGNAARAQAYLALAAKRTGRTELSDWLRRRVELLADVQELARQRPILWELWQK
jgi:hypothetical protein